MKLINNFLWYKKFKSLRKIQLLVLDVDGVLTDGKLYYNDDGSILKSFNVRDGIAIKFLQSVGIKTAFLSGGSKESTIQRAQSLNIDKCLFGIKNKKLALKSIQLELDILPENTAFIGDDLNDIPVFESVNLFITTADSAIGMKKKAHLVLNRKGGDGAVREFAEWLLKAKGVWNNFCEKGWLDTNI